MTGIPASIILMAVVALAIGIIWPLMGMPITLQIIFRRDGRVGFRLVT